ncbi:MAG TPA: CrcB family protein [Acidimicrobiia bacterium]|nr:CrcB family protein [Acidimicrobiia bacterium]
MIILAALAGAVGALARYLLSGVVQQRIDRDLPVGTLAVNLSGALLIGVVVGIDHLQSSATLIAAGFLGGFTTFSTWMIETIRLGIPPLRSRALFNLIITLIAGVALAAVGYSLTN